MKNLGLLILTGAAAFLIGSQLFPREVVVPGPPVETVIDLSNSTRADYEARLQAYRDDIDELEDELEEARNQPVHYDTTYIVRRVEVPIPCPDATASGVDTTAILAGQWYLTRASFADDPADEGLVEERWIAVFPGRLQLEDRLHEVWQPGPVTSIEALPTGLHIGFGDWPTPSCRITTKLAWGAGGMGLAGLLNLLLGN